MYLVEAYQSVLEFPRTPRSALLDFTFMHARDMVAKEELRFYTKVRGISWFPIL